MLIEVSQKKWLIIFLALSITSLWGCQAMPPTSHTPAKNQPIKALQHFYAEGVLGLRMPDGAQNLHWEWQAQADHYTLTLRAPLGVGTLKVVGKGGYIALIKPDGQKVSAKNPEQLLLQETGWSLPISGLADWIKGQPIKGVACQTIDDANHRLSILKQNGWTIHYLHYTRISGMNLPDKINFNTEKIFLKVVIKKWQILNSDRT